jgi:predicted O-methyltransferase YrrM
VSDAQTDVVARLEETATGYMGAMILFAATDLGVFDALEAPSSVAELAARLAVTPDGLRRLCRALASMGLLTMRGDRLEPVAAARAALVQGAEGWAVLRHHGRQLMPLFSRLAEAVRTGETQEAAWSFASSPPAGGAYAELARHPAELATFLAAMDRSSRGVGAALAPLLRERGVRRMVDLGCGGGVVAREILGAITEITIESFDLAPACAIAHRRSIASGYGDRHLVRPGNLLEGTEARGADAVLLSAILADWSASERAAILAGARENLRPGGYLFVGETLLDDDRSGPMGPAILSLVMLLAMHGDQLSGAELKEELERAGFGAVQVIRGAPRDWVIAQKVDDGARSPE